jgi:hypothetical protein
MSKKFILKDWMKIRKESEFDEHKIRFKPIINGDFTIGNDYIDAMSYAADQLRRELEKQMFKDPPFATGGRVYGYPSSYIHYADDPIFDFTGYKSPIDGERMDIDDSEFNYDPFGIQSVKGNLTTPQKIMIYRFHIMCGRCLKKYTKYEE